MRRRPGEVDNPTRVFTTPSPDLAARCTTPPGSETCTPSPALSMPTSAPDPEASPDPEPRSLRLEDWLIVLTMVSLALITFVNVVVRYFTDASFAWTEEISVFLMIALALVGGSAAVARQLHIRIEFYADGGSERRRHVLARFGALMVALLFALITVLSVRMVWDDYRFEETSPGIGVPQWWYSIWLPVLCGLTTARALQLFVRLGRERTPTGARP